MAAIYDVLLNKLRSAKTAASAVASVITGATAKTTPVDADNVPITDSAASNALKKVTWANIKATLKTYFDSLYSPTGAVTSVTGTPPVASSGGTTPAISMPAATNASAGHATASHIQAIEANTLKVTNATHTGDVTGSGELTIGANKVHLTMVEKIPQMTFLGNGDTGASAVTVSNAPSAAYDGVYDFYAVRGVTHSMSPPFGFVEDSTPHPYHALYILNGDDAITGHFIGWDGSAWILGQFGQVTEVDTTSETGLICPSTTWDNGSVMSTGTVYDVQPMSASTARTTMGLGTIVTQNANSVSITGGSVTGITDLAVTDGGTGASDAAGARTNLGLGTAATGTSQSATLSAPLTTTQAFSVIGASAPTLAISAASTSAAGSMSAADKLKVDGMVPDWELVAVADYTAEPASTSSITVADESDFTVGQPLKYTYGGTTYYGMVTALSSNLVTIAGAPLVTGGGSNLTALYRGNSTHLIQMSLFVNGTYGDGVDTDLLKNDMYSPKKWVGPAAYVVRFALTHGTVDSGASQPKVNVTVGASAISTNDTNKGLQLSGQYAYPATVVDINTTNYAIAWGDEFELSCTAAGTNGDAEDLTAEICIVLP